MADDIEFGGEEEMTEAELPEGMAPVDVDAVIDEVDVDLDHPIADDTDAPAKSAFDDEEGEPLGEELDPEEEKYFLGDYDER